MAYGTYGTDVRSLQGSDGHLHKIKGDILYVAINETSSTATLTATTPFIDEYYDGLMIAFRWPFANVASSTLNINGLGAKPIYCNVNTTSASQFSSGAIYIYVYSINSADNSGNGCWKAIKSYDSGNSGDYRHFYYTILNVSSHKVFKYSLFSENEDGTFESFTNKEGNTTDKVANSNTNFKIGSPILYYSSSTASSTTASTSSYIGYDACQGKYTGNFANPSSGSGFVTHHKIYMCVTLHGDGTYSPKDQTAGTLQSILVTDAQLISGNDYILIGSTYLMINNDFQFCLFIENPFYHYDGTSLVACHPNDLYGFDAPVMTSTSLGVAKLGSDTVQTVAAGQPSSTSGKTYPVQLNANDQLVVNVPWTNTNTDTKVTQTLTSTNASYPLLLAPSGQSSTQTTTSYFDSGVTLNPYTNTIAASISGNAASATKLENSRTFSITGGATASGVSFNGTQNVALSVSSMKESYLDWGGKNFSGTYGPIDAAMIDELGANRFQFLNPAGITIEYSNDNGSTWIDYGATNAVKQNIFSTNSSSVIIGKASTASPATANDQLRITVNSSDAHIYTEIHKFTLYVSTNGCTGCWCSIDIATAANPTQWVNKADKVSITGQSGYNVINVSKFTTYGNQTSQYKYIRFTFGCNTGSTQYAGLSIYNIKAFGGVGWTTPSTMAKTGHLYSFDSNQTAIFPNTIQIKKSTYAGTLDTQSLTAARTWTFPNASGTVALTSDISSYVAGPSSSTDNAIARFDGTTGKLIQNSTVTISDTGLLQTSAQIKSTVATGTAPFVIASTTAVTNLNADLLDGKHASSFALSDHTHISLKANTDNRSVDTIPNDYNAVFKISGLKYNSTIGISNEGSCSAVFGIRAWTESSEGDAHEFALANGHMYIRSGATTTWNDWQRIAYMSDMPNGYGKIDCINSASGTTVQAALTTTTYNEKLTLRAYNGVVLSGTNSSTSGSDSIKITANSGAVLTGALSGASDAYGNGTGSYVGGTSTSTSTTIQQALQAIVNQLTWG